MRTAMGTADPNFSDVDDGVGPNLVSGRRGHTTRNDSVLAAGLRNTTAMTDSR